MASEKKGENVTVVPTTKIERPNKIRVSLLCIVSCFFFFLGITRYFTSLIALMLVIAFISCPELFDMIHLL